MANERSVLIIGGGVAGIQTAIELADFGIKVFIAEKEATLGGNILRVGKVFPTDDCGLCISRSELLKGTRGFRKCYYRLNIKDHPNIKILTRTVVKSVERKNGGFKVKLERHPMGVDPEKCTLCGECAKACPVEVPDDLNLGLSKRKAIYLPHPQAMPLTYVVDFENCNKCGKCVEVCKFDAISLDGKSESMELEVDAIVVATGFEELDPTLLKEYGYGMYKNVITQLQLARLLDPNGPTGGEVKNLESGELAKRVVMTLCSGSRDQRLKPYCSKICCTYALKHALMLREKGIEVIVCFMDIRTFGEYEDYYRRARAEGVRFIRGRVGAVEKQKDKLLVYVEDTYTSTLQTIEADLLVITPAIVPSKGTEEISKILGIETDEYGFIKTKEINGVETMVDGIFAVGCATGPKSIPDLMNDAYAATIRILNSLK
ncbi:MAG: FAD-dependent oxidoreductase [Candidatus Baldrarchaeia archaeon]